jgi:putative hydrolase of the HAD superfamily
MYCLDEFSRFYRLALLTNGPADLQREKIGTTGIEKYFTEIIISGEVGYVKPDCRIYQLLLSRLAANPESTWNIGDSLERDITGAKAIGIKTIWVNRHGISRDESIVPDLEVSNLGQLVTNLIPPTKNPNLSL